MKAIDLFRTVALLVAITRKHRCSCKRAMHLGWCRWHGWQE